MYTRLGLGALILNALNLRIHDPEAEAKADAATNAVDALSERVSALAAHVQANDTISSDQANDITEIAADLKDLSAALGSGVLTQVEPPATSGTGDGGGVPATPPTDSGGTDQGGDGSAPPADPAPPSDPAPVDSGDAAPPADPPADPPVDDSPPPPPADAEQPAE